MRKPLLVVMAAGLGSRFGGQKQTRAVGPNQQALMDYSLYDAMRAGFEDVVFVISAAMEKDFPDEMRARLNGRLNARFAVQRLDDMPSGRAVPEGRTKPWGTGHAVRAARAMIDGPFAAINADDYYGRESYRAVFEFLASRKPGTAGQYALVGFQLKNTLSESGSVARGICAANEDGELTEIRERTHIIDTCDGPMYTEDNLLYRRLPDDAVASMNLWGFTGDFARELDGRFDAFLETALRVNPLKAEYFLPEVVSDTIRDGVARAAVLPCAERWYGITYANDLPVVQRAIREMTDAGVYPERLWE